MFELMMLLAFLVAALSPMLPTRWPAKRAIATVRKKERPGKPGLKENTFQKIFFTASEP